PYEYADFDQFLKQQKEKEGLLTVLILDGLEDPHNLGSILRTADATGVDGVIIPKRRSVTLTQTVAKASTGAIEHVPVIRVTNLAKTIDELKDNGFWVAGTEANNATDYRNLEADMSLAIVIGSEGQGMSRLVSDKCDFYIKIPMVGHVNSLNASVAASLMMYEVFRKRHDVGEI
ncbi:TPA: 23S rRNA (guanosine(2251)-2'-O)-methyltransferase RlmB, partial [Staphylococcus aureus]